MGHFPKLHNLQEFSNEYLCKMQTLVGALVIKSSYSCYGNTVQPIKDVNEINFNATDLLLNNINVTLYKHKII